MSDAAVYSAQLVTVAAGQTRIMDATGEYIACLSCNLTSFGLSIDGATAQFMQQGLTVREKPGATFSQFIIDNSANGSTLVVLIAWGQGTLIDARLPATVASQNFTAPGDISVPAGGSVLVVAADQTRMAVILSNPINNSREFRIGPSTVGVSQGVELPPGAQLRLDTQAAIYAYNPHTAALPVCLSVIGK